MIKAALAAYAAATARVFEDRAQTVGASDVGQCIRRVFWTKMAGDATYGAAPDPEYVDGWGARIRGTTYESAFWVPAMRARFGDKLLYAGVDQRTLVSGFLSATPDGVLIKQPRDALVDIGIPDIGASGDIVIEAKTIDPRARLDEARAEHSYQVQVQMGLLREVTRHRPEFAVISYADASFWDAITEFVIPFNPAIYANAQHRAAQIMLAQSAEELRPEGWIAGGRECERCPFATACGRARTTVPGKNDAEADPQFVAELSDLARQAKRHEADADTASVQLRAVQNEIRERLRAKGLRRITGDGVSIVWSPIKGWAAFDMKGIREAAARAGIDLAEYETTGQPTDRLVIQVTEQSR